MSGNPFQLTQKDILEALTHFLPIRSTSSSALENIQGYGQVSPSPNWNVPDNNTESSLTPSRAFSSTPFNSLNLASVDEEDEFLYGDSNSVSEEQISVKEESVVNNRFDSGWSDDEDPYGEKPKPVLNKLNSRLRKNIPDYDSQNKIQETKQLPIIQKEVIDNSSPLRRIPEQNVSYDLKSDSYDLSSRIEQNQFSEVNPNLVREKSKYHVAAEILKKRNTEKNSSSCESLETFSRISKKEPERNVDSLPADLKTAKLPVKRSTPVLNKKHVDNIRDYITGSRKRSYPPEEFPPEKQSRYETSRTSPSRHLPQKFSSAIPKSRSTYPYSENDMKYISSSSRYRSPSYESEKQHHSRYPESRRRYSRSPKRRSRTPDYKHHRRSPERNTDYSRYKDRSPKSRRSRSPGYYSSKSKTYDKKSRKSPKKSDQHSKKKKKSYSSGDSFCSLSLGSSSDSSNSSDESSEEEKKTKKLSVKPTPKEKHETEKSNIKSTDDTHSKQPESDDLSKKISDIFDAKNSNLPSEFLDPANLQQILSVVQPSKEQLLMNFLERQMASQQQQTVVTSDSLTFAAPTSNIASSLQMPVIPSSESYVYPTVPAAPIQYVAPQMTNFQPMIPSATFPTPRMTTTTPATPMTDTSAPAGYGSYLPVPSNDSQFVSNVVPKSVNVRPSALKTVPLTPPVSSSSVINIRPSDSPVQKSVSRPEIQESNDVKITETKKTVDQKNKEKVSEKNSSSLKHVSENTSEQTKQLIIEKYKKMKTERVKALNKAKSASDDLDEMRRLLEETFGKKTSLSEKLLYTKCKSQFNLSLDISSQANREARRADENLNSFKSKLPTALQQEVSKIKLEPYKDEPVTNEKISCLDQGDHTCSDCYIFFSNVKEFLSHIQSPEHKAQMEMSKQDWKKDFIKEPKKEDKPDEQKKAVLKPVKGSEFVKPLNGFYCSLCKEVFLEESTAEQHLKSHQHFVSYENYTVKRAPLYEMKRLFKRYIKMVIATRQKKEERKKKMEADDKLAKEIRLKEKNKEIIYEELEEKESENLNSSGNQMTANIKLNLYEKDDDKSVEKKHSTKELESKNSPKFIYIGKAPNFKKVPPKPWYKKDNVPNVKEPNASPSPSNVIKSVEKSSEKSQYDEVKPSSSLKSSEKSKFKNDWVEIKSSSESFSNQKNIQNVGQYPYPTLNKGTQNKISDVKQTAKSCANVSSPSKYNVQLSEIKLPEAKLPETSSLPSSSNANIPQPMDIDNSQDCHNKPKSEEEKDFLLLGIKREDFQPLVIPVPPPTSMVSYPSMSNVQTFSSNVGCATTSTSSINHDPLKSLDFSKPPPNMAPYQSNAPPAPVYGNQNNTQNVGQYSYPTQNSQISAYSSPSRMNVQTSYQPIPPFTTPPPAFRNPPPILPYSNTGNRQPVPQFPNSNNLPYNSYANPVPININNQIYQPSVYPVPLNNQAHFSIQNASQNLAPPGSEYDTSYLNNFNAVTTAAPVYVHQSKISPSLKKVGNLTVIVPEEKKINAKDNSKTIHEAAPKNIKTIVEYRTHIKMTKNTIKPNESAMKTSQIIVPLKESTFDTKNNNQKMNKHPSKTGVKGIVNECFKKVEESPNISCTISGNSVKTDKVNETGKNKKEFVAIKTSEKIMEDSAQDSKVILKKNTENMRSDSEFSKDEQVKANDKISDIVSEAGVFNIETGNANDSREPSTKVSGEQMPSASIETGDRTVSEKSSNSPADNSNKTGKVAEDTESEKVKKNNAQDDYIVILEESDDEEANKKMKDFKVGSKNNKNVSEKNIKISKKQVLAQSEKKDNCTIIEMSSNICSLANNPVKTDEITENVKKSDFTAKVSNEKNIQDNKHDTSVEIEQDTESPTNVSVLLKDELVKTNYTNEYSFDKNNENQEKDCEEFVRENSKVDSKKDVERSFSAENSNYNIKNETEDVGILQDSKMVEDKIMDDSCINKKALGENLKNCFIILEDINKPSGRNNMLQNDYKDLMPVLDSMDTDQNDSKTDIPYIANENNDIPNLKCEEEIFGQDLKVKNDVSPTFSDYSFLDLPDKTESIQMETDRNEIKDEKSENICSPVKKTEGSEISPFDKVMQTKSADVTQDACLKLHKNKENSEALLENKMKVTLESEKEEKDLYDTPEKLYADFQDTEEKSKKEIALESDFQDTEEKSKMEVSLESEDNSSQNASEAPVSSSSSTTRSGRLIRHPERLGYRKKKK